tara:strand:- start:585 stop:998 length:414 start_codon:yes stop_codon:yes gene_type:complete
MEHLLLPTTTPNALLAAGTSFDKTSAFGIVATIFLASTTQTTIANLPGTTAYTTSLWDKHQTTRALAFLDLVTLSLITHMPELTGKRAALFPSIPFETGFLVTSRRSLFSPCRLLTSDQEAYSDGAQNTQAKQLCHG